MKATPTPIFEITNPLNDQVYDLICVDMGEGCSGIIEQAELPHNIEFARLAVMDSLPLPDDSLTYRWWVRRGIYTALQANDTILETDSVLQAFYDDYRLNAVELKIDSIRREIAMFILDTFDIEVFDELRSKLLAVQPGNGMESNLVGYADNILQISKGIGIHEIEWAIDNIAKECVFTGGPAVLEARAYMVGKDWGNLFKNWEDSCSVVQYKREPSDDKPEHKNITQTYSYILYPNITSTTGISFIDIPANQAGRIEIYGIDGRFAFTYNLTEGNNSIAFNKAKFHTGLYIYKIWIDDEFKHTGKIVFVK